jgi:hypothetical protein
VSGGRNNTSHSRRSFVLTEQIIKIAATILQAAAIVVTAIFASRGLHAWRRQLIGKRKFEIAEEILVITYKVQGHLANVRSPIRWGGEGASRPRPKGIEPATERKDMYFVPLERLGKLSDDFAQISKARLLAQIHFGAEAVRPFDAIRNVYHEIAVAGRMLVETAEDPRREVGEALVSGWEATIWDTSERMKGR